MEILFAITAGTLYATGLYLMLRRRLAQLIIGLGLLSNGTNLLIFTAGRIYREVPPIIPAGLDVPQGPVANPLPQALILTAIVISFSFFAFLLVLAFRAFQEMGTDDTDEMRLAEPLDEPLPPLGY